VKAFQGAIEQFGEKMRLRMQRYLLDLIRSGFSGAPQQGQEKGQQQKGEEWPIAPEPPCLCSKCPDAKKSIGKGKEKE